MTIWLLSLALEAVLALLYSRRGGFPAFRRFLLADILCQLAAIAARATWGMTGYIPVEIAAEVITGVLLGFVVAESWRSIAGEPSSGLVIKCAIGAIATHFIVAEPAWSATGSLLLWSVALSHVIMFVLLIMIQFTSKRWRWHESILAGWMLGTAVLFYAAPRFAVGYSVLWLNSAAWAALIAAAGVPRECQQLDSPNPAPGPR